MNCCTRNGWYESFRGGFAHLMPCERCNPQGLPQGEQDEPDVEVCANCGAYYDGRYGGQWQRCGPCRVGLPQGTEAGTAKTVEQGLVHDGPVGKADAPKEGR